MSGAKKTTPKSKKEAPATKPSNFYIHKLANGKDPSRAYRWQLRLFKIRLTISLRRFRTKASNRSKLQSQLVLPLYWLPFKELSFTGKRRRQAWSNPVQKFLAQSKYLSRLNPLSAIIILIGIGGIFLFGPSVYGATRLNIKTSNRGVIQTTKTVTPSGPLSTARSIPTDIRIPSIEVDAPVFPVDLQPDGSLLPPKDFTTTGWYDRSPTPGEIGPSVIVGHVDHVGGIGVFWDLRLLQVGDEIDVDHADGTVAKFSVDALREYSQNNFPTQIVYGNTSYAGLRLITCGGVFDEQTGHYTNNVVIFASLEQ